jgi:uncharacterized protein YbbC (DUF1343 family)
MVTTGIDNIRTVSAELADYNLGLITGPSGADRALRPTYEILNEQFHLTALYSPEHGIRGEAQAGSYDEKRCTDAETGLPLWALSGAQSHPGEEMLAGIDAMVFDIQDAGARFYTYLYTMTRAMRSCARDKKPFYVLDRPNPLGLRRTGGNILDERFSGTPSMHRDAYGSVFSRGVFSLNTSNPFFV